MKAIVLCGGEGTRLRPYTYSIPKPMLPLGRKPILEYVINNLKHAGITDIILNVGYLSHQIKNHFGDGKKFGVKLTYFEEKQPLNTAGSILQARHLIKDTFVVLMGDHLTTIDLKKMIEHHRKSGCMTTIGLKRQGTPLEYGVAKVNPKGHVEQFEEKPLMQNLINSAIYIFEPGIYNYIREREDFAKNVFPRMLAEKKHVNAYIFDDYWVDIGRMTDYEKLHQMVSVIDLVLHGYNTSKK